jgi:hypothetical protein
MLIGCTRDPGTNPACCVCGRACAAAEALRQYDGPSAFAIPGNHDWIDGLETFQRYIQHRGWLGGWLLPQVPPAPAVGGALPGARPGLASVRFACSHVGGIAELREKQPRMSTVLLCSSCNWELLTAPSHVCPAGRCPP